VRVGKKFDAFIDCKAPVEFLEGTTAAGKTTVGTYKFLWEVAESPKKQHIIAGLDNGTIEKNIITAEHGILDEWGPLVEYNGNGNKDNKLPHILFKPAAGVEKIIYVMGYADKVRWKKALGGQYGCLYIDEINIADMEFVREASMRCDYLMATLNPDDPSLPVYKEYINHSRPLKEWAADTPKEILEALSEEPKPGWVHWFFSFKDNIALTEEKREQIIRNVPKGTKLYKNKILGLRGRSTGLVFDIFDEKKHCISWEDAKALMKDKLNHNQEEWFEIFTSGLDTAYSSQSPDIISMTFGAITNKGRVILLEEKGYNNAQLQTPLAPSDTIVNYFEFLERCRREWDGFARNVFIDSADQATITEAAKYKRSTGCIYVFNGAYKKTPNIDRIILQNGWLNGGNFLVGDWCKGYINELNTYSWMEDKDNTPEDGNDHYIQSWQYGWLPYKKRIGV